MLERVAAWFLNTYVAEYVGNVLKDQLSIGLLRGAVELEKLPLKKDALKKLKLPVNVKSGYIGKLKLQIPPVRYIKSQPWVVQIDQLYIIVGPPQPGDYNASEEEEQVQAKKQAKLDKLEEEWKAEQQRSSSWWFKWLPVTTFFPSNVIANLQVIVNDVHIRYEDSEVDPSQPFAVGMLLENVSAQSTDENWEPKFVTDEKDARKLFDLQNFAIYWDTEVLGDLEGEELVDAMLLKHASVVSQEEPMTASTMSGEQPPVEFIIRPVSGQAKLTRNCSKTSLRIVDGPRFHLDVQVDEIPVVLSDKQYQSLVNLFEVFGLRVRAQMYRKWRPNVAVKESPQVWWRFAIDCVLSRIRRKNQSITFALNRARQNVAYVEGYTQHLTQASVSEEVHQQLGTVEKEQNFEELAVLRKIAMARVKKERDLAEAARRRIESETQETSQGILQRWFPGWISGYQAPVPSDQSENGGLELEAPDTAVSELNLKDDELLDELGYEALDDNLFLRDRIFLALEFSLRKGSFQLVTTPTSQTAFLGPELLIELGFNSLCCAVDLRPRLRYACFDLSLGSLSVQDHTNEESLFPVLVQPKGAEVVGDRGQLFQRQYTVVDPLDSQPSSSLFKLKLIQEEFKQQKQYHLRVHSKPLDIVYNPSTIAQVKEFFQSPLTDQNTVHQLQQELQSHTTAELRNRIEGILEPDNKTSDHRISVNLDVSAPHLIIPEDFTNRDTSMVVLDLGHLTFRNVSDWSTEEKGLGVEDQVTDIDEDDDDIFTTPPSSPPSEEEVPDSISLSQPVPSLELHSAIQAISKDRVLRNDPYDRYLLSLSDLQVLVGKVDESWREAVRSGHSQLHLLDKFTLSVRLQRMLKYSSEATEAYLSLSANLPSLNFHVDEQKVQALFSCLRPLQAPDSVPPSKATSPIKLPPDFATSMYQSALSTENFIQGEASMGTSMYYSMEAFFGESSPPPSSKRSSLILPTLQQSKVDPQVAKEKHQRRLLVAREKLLGAQLSIDEVNLSLSGRGKTIADLSVPGVKFAITKRPYDVAVKLLVQDLCLVDRIQTFGPEYELVVCSSGKTLLSTSPFGDSPVKKSPPESFDHRSFSCPNFSSLRSKPHTSASSKDDHGIPSSITLPVDTFLTTSEEEPSALLALTYSHVGPYSPNHPAVMDDETAVSESETNIQTINIKCTAVDVIANQETVVELISFFRRVIPEKLLSSGGSAVTTGPTTSASSMETQAKVERAVQTEVKVDFERLGIRILRKVERNRKLSRSTEAAKQTTTQLIANFTFYGVAIEGRFSTDTAIHGKLEGVQIADLTSAGKKYPSIVSMGLQSVQSEASLANTDAHVESSSFQQQPQCFSFSINRSPRVSTLALKECHDIHITAFVPSIHYTHSVNFIYEMEMFISELQLYSETVTNSFKSAAVGVAKGFVREKSQLAEGLGKLSTSFGPTSSRASFSQSINPQDEIPANDEPDVGLPLAAGDRLYFDVSAQSPVIILPSSLHSDECLIAHLGEISVKNEFIHQSDTSLTEEAILPSYVLTSPEIDRLVLTISNMSVHASHDRASRDWLLTKHIEMNSSTSGESFKVLKETSLRVQVDRGVGNGFPDTSRDDANSEDSNSETLSGADVVIIGKICDPLLVRLPKEVFDQVKSTLKHGLRRNIPPRAKPGFQERSFTATERNTCKDSSSSKSVKFNPVVQTHSDGETLPKIFASFSLPKLSLELKHTLDGKERNLVYVSFEDFSIQCNKSSPHTTSVDLALKSIIIEDLLQEEDSEFRYILASSSKPLPFISPVSSPSLRLPKSQGIGSSISRHLLSMTKLMSTPRVQQSNESPLRSFSPYEEPKSPQKTDSESTLEGSGKQETQSTLCEDTSSFSEVGDLVRIKALLVDEKCPDFATKYNSVCIHTVVDFNSVYVIVNLQTWVVLFDYLGIGIPTPPSSGCNTPTNEDSYYTERLTSAAELLATRNGQKSVLILPSDRPGVRLPTTSQLDQSLLEDARDFCSLGSDEASVYDSNEQPHQSQREPVFSLGMPEAAPRSQASEEVREDVEAKNTVWGVEGKMTLDLKLHVRSLTVTFNKPEHPLARGTASSLQADVSLSKGNLQLKGSLGQGSVVDLTETGAYYRDRFTTTGNQALKFEIFKYGRPDPLMERPFDVSAKVQMASVRYLHTMRFLKEILAFLSHFPQLIDAFQRMKAMAQGHLVYHGPERKARISLDVMISGPVLLIPKHAFSPELMVGDIGYVRCTNRTLYEGEEGTLSFMRKQQGLEEPVTTSCRGSSTRVLPKLSPQASVQSQLSAISTDERFSVHSPVKPGSSVSSTLQGSLMPNWGHGWSLPSKYDSTGSDNSIFGSGLGFSVEEDRQRIERQLEAVKGPCLLDCIMVDLSEVDVFSARRVELGNDFKIVRQPGKVVKEKGAAKLYIERNLYEDFCRDVPDIHIEGKLEAIHVMLDKSQLELVKGLIDMNLGEGIEDFEKPSTVIRDPVAQPVAADVWTGFLFRMQFVGVQLEFLQSRETDTPGSLTRSLALFDIQQSELSFESRSNQSKTVDFTSHAVIGYDTRYTDYPDEDKPSVYSEFLRPRFTSPHAMKKSIQAEIHVAFSPTHIKASILLNKLRLIGIFDLILALKSFIIDKIPEEVEEDDVFDEVDTALSVGNLRERLTSRLARHTPPEENKPDRDIRLNLSVTETDFVVVEDMTSLESNAVVLKSTLVLQFRSCPSKEKTLHCSIDGLELFSCSLSNEDETALSILDPVSVTVDVKPPDAHGRRPAKHTLMDAICTQTLEIDVQQLNFRLSYNDIKLFLAIAQSLPSLTPPDQHRSADRHLRPKEGEIDDTLVKKLLPLGFSRAAIRKELYLSDGNLDTAALKLLEQQQLQQEESEQQLMAGSEGRDDDGEGGDKKGKAFTIGNIEVVVESLSVCLIDDCVNHDMPLLDFSLSHLRAEHDLLIEKKGRATADFSGEYYNRNISAWEPVVEPWRLQLSWEKVAKFSTDLDNNDQTDRMYITLSSPEQLCVNVTSSLIHILKATQASWTKDIQNNRNGDRSDTKKQVLKFQTHRRTGSGIVVPEESFNESSAAVNSMEKGLALLHSVRFISQTRQRIRFVPFLLRNSTGLPLRFATLTSVPTKVYVSPLALYQKTRGGGKVGGVVSELGKTSEWMEVPPGGEKPFDFITKRKLRHRDTHSLIVHQLLVKVSGWQRNDIPVSVDKIGVFFREVEPSTDSDHDSLHDLPPTRGTVRLVFAISLSDTQKVVNVRSALVLHNTMEFPLEVRLEYPEEEEEERALISNGSIDLPPLSAKGYAAIPLHLTSWNIKVRPQGWGVQYCSKHLSWKHVVGRLQTSHTRACEAIGESEEEPPFRFCVSVQRENFPPDPPSPASSPNHPYPSTSPWPAHTITLHPPLTVANLLPCDIQFYLPAHRGVRKIVNRGKEIAVYSVDSLQPVEFLVAIENFLKCQGCIVSLQDVGVIRSMMMDDTRGSPLQLKVTTEVLGGGAMKISISCAYWLINRTGLPLVFRQEGVDYIAAGQSEEHEKASTIAPLLFSYAEGETIEKCTIRLGNEYRYLGGGQPSWCAPFRMISESGVIRVFVRSRDGRPDKEYQIGVDIRRGRRQYQNTRVVTFVARYQLENRTQYKLAYLQRHQLQEEKELSQAKKIPILMPTAIVQFHWPRTDLDQLLTVRLADVPDCHWSGGFTLDKDYSFHINMRGNFGRSTFVRCEVTLKGATYQIIFSDAANYPPPFRLENLSQMPVAYFQTGIAKSILITPLSPGQSVPYAWDEPTLPERLCLQAKGSREVKEFDLGKFGPQGKLYYESYFYITATATFPKDSRAAVFQTTHYRGDYPELVLDVPQGTAVIFKRKDPEQRTQLWRMTPTRQLVHISSSSNGENMVLDIASNRLPASGHFVPLVIRRMSSSRDDNQTWRFLEDGRLIMADSPHLCVQSQSSGYQRFREGADVVLGHTRRLADGVPPEHKIRRLKHSPGSGVLSVRVVSDGPTRILRITDENQKYTHTAPRDDWVVVDHGLVAPSKSSDVDQHGNDNSWDSEEEGDSPALEMELSLILEKGVGISLINSVPEELIFATLTGIRVEVLSSPVHQCLNVTIQHIQVDNQLPNSHIPVLAYPTPPQSGEPECSLPVLRLFAERVPHKSPFAIIFRVLEVKVCEMSLLMEEKLLFKLLQWAGVGRASSEEKGREEEIMHMLTQRTVGTPSSSEGTTKQLYFEKLAILSTELRVSMHTTSQLPEDLQKIKRHLGFPLVKFESPVSLNGLHRSHTLGTPGVYADVLMKHYRKVVKSQAINILGSVDFLGNPVGLLSDVASGVSGMIAVQPDVMGLVRDVAHGMSDTTSKLTGTVSHVLGQATFDSSFQEEREQLLESCQTSGDHLKAGLIGLTSGVFGGVTSLITQPYKGVQQHGIGGFFTGVGKGLLGTVAKPVAGLFDFASGTTAALRETTSRVSRYHPPPVRHRRCCVDPSGALTRYSVSQARGQEYLLRLTDGELSEKLVSYELLNESQTERMRVIISSQCLYFFRESPPDPSTIEAKYSLDDLVECRPAPGKRSIPTMYIVVSLIEKQREGGESSFKAPKFKCADEKQARKVAQLINYAKNLHEEEKHIVRTLRLQQDTIW